MKGGKAMTETKADTRMKRKGAATERTGKKTARKEKAAKDPNKPKRPPSAFFVFMEGFRQTYKENHPQNKSVAAVGKAGGDQWKSMSDAEKAPFIAKAEKRKEEYNKKMLAYNNKSSEDAKSFGSDESDKSKSEVEDENEVENDQGDEDDD